MSRVKFLQLLSLCKKGIPINMCDTQIIVIYLGPRRQKQAVKACFTSFLRAATRV